MVWGGWDGHEPRQSTDIVAKAIADDGFDVEIADTLMDLDSAISSSLGDWGPVGDEGFVASSTNPKITSTHYNLMVSRIS